MDKKINPTEIGNLVKILDYLDLEYVPVSPTQEAVKDYMLMSSKQLERQKYRDEPIVLKVNKAVVESIPKIVEEFKESKGWYEQFNQALVEILGDSEGAFFLAIMAATSPNERLESNLKLATQAFHALIHDIKYDEDLLLEYFDVLAQYGYDKRTMNKYDRDDHPYKDLKFHKYIVRDSHLNNHNYITVNIAKYYIDHGKDISPTALAKFIAGHMDKSGRIEKNQLFNSHKVFNFVLNLLDPNYEDEMGWMPVTIDTWMITFFYPQIKEVDPDWRGFKAKVFSNYKKYTYLAKIVQEHAGKVGLKPHELQAILWVATIKKYQPNAGDKDIGGTIKYMLEQFNEDQKQVQIMLNFAKRLSSVIEKV